MLKIIYILLLWYIVNAKEPELPLCPANVQYLPQNLPMHCRMPTKVEKTFQLPPGFQMLQGMQSIPGMTMPQPGTPGQAVITGLQPPPLPQIPIPGLTAPMMPQKLPVVVMPYYSPVKTEDKPRNVKRRHMYSNENSDDSTSLSTEDDYRNARRHNSEKRRKLKVKKPLITPLLQYVTKDGYVIFEKKISNGEASKWLNSDDDKVHKEDSQERFEELKNLKINKIAKLKALQARKSKMSGKH